MDLHFRDPSDTPLFKERMVGCGKPDPMMRWEYRAMRPSRIDDHTEMEYVTRFDGVTRTENETGFSFRLITSFSMR